MKIAKSIMLVAVVTVLFSCSSYKAREDGFGKMGYEEKKLEDGSYLARVIMEVELEGFTNG